MLYAMRNIWILLLLCAPFAVSQDTAMLFRVGQTRDEVVAAHGEPKFFYVATKNEYYRSNEKAARESWPYSDVYQRKTPHGTYEVHVWYARYDKVPRVTRFDFVPEKVVSWRDVANDIAEIKQICADQCTVAAVEFGYWNIDIFTPSASPEVIDMLAKAHYGSFERGKSSPYYEYRPGAQLTWGIDWTLNDEERKKKKQKVPKDWNKAEIDFVMVGYVETKWAFHNGPPDKNPAPVPLAVWKP